MERCRTLSATFTLLGDRVRIQSPQLLPDDVIADLMQAKTQELRREGSPSYNCWILQGWRRISIPKWRRILTESRVQGNKNREEYALWMLQDILNADEGQEEE